MGPKAKHKLSKRQKQEAAEEAANGKFQKVVSRRAKRKTPATPQSPTSTNEAENTPPVKYRELSGTLSPTSSIEAQDTSPEEYNPYFPYKGPQRDFTLEGHLEQGSSIQHHTSHQDNWEGNPLDPSLNHELMQHLSIREESEFQEPTEHPEHSGNTQSAKFSPKGEEHRNLEAENELLREKLSQTQLEKEHADSVYKLLPV